MLYSDLNENLQHVVHHLRVSIKKLESQELVKVTPSGSYRRADALDRLLLAESRNYVFEFYETYLAMKSSILLQEKTSFLTGLKAEQNHHIAHISKRAHFYGFSYLNGIGLKAVIDAENNSYLYIPLQRFCDHIVDFKSSLGMKNIEIIQYFNFLNLSYSDASKNNCFILNLYKDSRINVFTFNEVETAIAEYDSFKSIGPLQDLTINREIY